MLKTTAQIAGTSIVIGGLWYRAVQYIGPDEQLRVQYVTHTVVFSGPGAITLNPLSRRSISIVKATVLGELDFVRVKSASSCKERIERGPKLLFLEADDDLTSVRKGQGVTLNNTEYMVVSDQLTGTSSTVKGPLVWFPKAYEEASGKATAVALQDDQYVRVKDISTGERWVKRGKALLFLEPTWRIEGSVAQAWTLKSYEYVRLLDSVTGKVSVHRGEQTVFPGPNEELLDGRKLEALDLKVDEYAAIEDQKTGVVRIAQGIDRVFLGPTEMLVDGRKKQAVQIDQETAVLVRDTATGQVRLVTEEQLFVPGPSELIQETRKLIKLEDHEAMIVKDKEGVARFHYGTPEKHAEAGPRSFFLEPFAAIAELWWSSGLRRAKRDLKITRFDCRPQYMWFEFDCRTADNVELVLEATFFWEVTDLAKLVRTTGNLPGDIYNQARSQFIKRVARVTLKAFMDELHSISQGIFSEDASFYESRGVKILSLNVTKYFCSEARTSEVLQQIIEETTNRLNRLSKAESENEVQLFRMQGQIEQQKLNGELLKIQHEHAQAEARVAGTVEAQRAAAFVKGLEEDVPDLDERVAMWQVIRKNEALASVSAGGAQLFYTPNDVNLSIRAEPKRSAPKESPPKESPPKESQTAAARKDASSSRRTT